MRSIVSVVASAAMAVGASSFMGCQPNNPNVDSSGSAAGTGGGRSTDTYGTSSNARYRSTGNIGTGMGAGPGGPTSPDSTVYPAKANNGVTVPVGEGGATAGAPNAGAAGPVNGSANAPSGADSIG